MAKKITAVVKLQLPAGKATPAPRRLHARTARNQYSRVHQGIQREDGRPGGSYHPRGHHHLPGPFFHVYSEDSARTRTHQKSVQDRKRQRETQPRQGGKTHPRTGGRDRKVENARSERDFAGIGDEHGQRHGAQHGRYGRRVKKEYVGEFISRLPQGGLR